MSYQNPRNRLEVRLKEIIDNSARISDPRSRFELLLAAIVDEDLSPDDLRDRIELYLGQLGGRASGGGITPSGTVTITWNGTHNVEQYKYASVAVTPATESYSYTLGSTGGQTINLYPTPGQYFNKVTLVRDDTIIKPENIKKDVTILGVTGTYDAGGSAYFGRQFTLTYRFTGSVDDPREQYLYYRGPDPLNPNNVIWRQEGLHADGQQYTTTIDLCPMLSSNPNDYENAIVDGFYIEGYDGASTSDVTVLAGDAACRYVEMSSGGQTGSEHYYIVTSGSSASLSIYLAN